ncbi:MAG: hypothetical protein A3J81_05280 [Nitrospirae bacterium RIFOXYB2_FULL_43_5]|nr:MAG: hypothetical protein A2X54_01790 [Nitrospirae bacterium GWF2_44_13]OGW34548.1 MAG: hypothetical protein A2088_05290 [Nitrospirae bacterium GWD2_44_7]OGW63996.1 MAG: hypothetical protein A2222_02000 [Nitrospirae bacterium RIFOXYA2_FULL_44_9]OGW73196.1 MAG: hypothetical protein A2484_06255 [Nitrospirae bacterium RIFOXYC2_FULL_44_7]OGW74049.1 MAG: hypothetical protein A3J81_05280 [Nitrospirae bacterium RIFOXYB2_FULL_43_5]HBG92946.1 hypothetical protein [Nitrospiraceae bacterium]
MIIKEAHRYYLTLADFFNALHCCLYYLFRLRLTHRTIWLPQIQEADMPSFRTAHTLVRLFFAYRTQFHLFNYII